MAGQLLDLSTTFSADTRSFLAATETCSTQLRRLAASIDPATSAALKFNRATEMVNRELERGRITTEQAGAFLNALRARFEDATQVQGKLASGSGQLRAGMQQLSYQVGDVAQGFASSTPPMTIFIQQSGQIIQAIQLMSGASKGFIGFLAGPWGAALAGAAAIVGSLVASHYKAADATDEHKKAADALKSAQDRLATAAAKANKETRQGIVDSIDAANAKRKEAQETLRVAQARLRDAASMLQSTTQANDEGGLGLPGAFSLSQVARYEAEIKSINAEMKTWSGNVAIDRSRLAMRDLAGQTDKTTKATQDYEDSLDRIKRKFEAGGFGNPADDPRAVAELKKQALAAMTVRDAALKAVQDAEKAEAEAGRADKKAATKAATEARQRAREADQDAKRLAQQAKKASEDLKSRSDAAIASAFPDENRINALQAQLRDLDEGLAAMLIDPVTWGKARARLQEQMDAMQKDVADKNSGVVEMMGTISRPIELPQLGDIKGVSQGITKSLEEQAKAAEEAKHSLVNMANESLNAISNLARSIEGGGVLDILSSVFNAFGSLSQSGLFGKKLETSFAKFTPISGFRASGGPVSAGQAYVVGERRPEVFVPDRSGYILPDADMAQGGGGRAVSLTVNPGPYFTVTMEQTAARVAAPMAVRAADGGSQLAQERIGRRQKNRIPGR